jgi:citrate lyase subunit beta / citryl-CoA lyase
VGEDADVLACARAQLVFAAAAAGAPALVDAVASPDFSRARRDGFGGAVVTSRAAAEACERIFA